MKNLLVLIGVLASFGCSSLNQQAPERKTASESRSVTFEGATGKKIYDLIKSQGGYEDCDGRTCTVEAGTISCSIERSLPGAECSWKVKTSAQGSSVEKSFDNKTSAAFYEKIKSFEVCEDGRTCTAEAREVSCTMERSLPDAECEVSQ